MDFAGRVRSQWLRASARDPSIAIRQGSTELEASLAPGILLASLRLGETDHPRR
jgi:hypothetical protein